MPLMTLQLLKSRVEENFIQTIILYLLEDVLKVLPTIFKSLGLCQP